jgi:hypothetical protein
MASFTSLRPAVCGTPIAALNVSSEPNATDEPPSAANLNEMIYRGTRFAMADSGPTELVPSDQSPAVTITYRGTTGTHSTHADEPPAHGLEMLYRGTRFTARA